MKLYELNIVPNYAGDELNVVHCSMMYGIKIDDGSVNKMNNNFITSHHFWSHWCSLFRT